MKDNKIIISHYLSLSHSMLIKNKIIHSFLFTLEILFILLQIIEIYCNEYNLYNNKNKVLTSPISNFLMILNKLPIRINAIIYIALILIIYILINCFYLLKIEKNLFIKIVVNISELLFQRLLSLFVFDYLFYFNDFYLIINFILTIPFFIILMINFQKYHLFLFFPSIINYPYDSFSMIIDLFLL